jgi:hypothetical protein
MKKNQGVRSESVLAWTGACRSGVARLLMGAALLCLAGNAGADQLQVTGANRDGNAVYDLGISPSNTTPVKPVFASTVAQINSAADAKTHAGFAALVWVPNSHCKSLDLIVADASDGQIVRYPGASTVAGCYEPANGTPTVSATAQIIFKWSKLGSGPAQPNGISADASGNVFAISSSGAWDSKPSVWVLPFNTTANLYCTGAAGVYCAPVLIDSKFGGILTLALAETVVASSAAVTSTKTVLWNAGDLLVLVGDSFDARLTVYAQNKLYTSNGLLNVHALPLNAPTSTPIPWLKFLVELADPFGMDIWPANTTLGTNQSVLFTTIDGRILRFDTVQNKFITDFADRLGAGLQKIKVGTYANAPYAFVAQIQAHDTGQILVFGAPPNSGANSPVATISRSVMNPEGLAVINSASQSLPTVSHGTPCAPPNAPCVIAPLGPELVSTITAYPGDNISGTVVEQSCSVLTDPRVTTAGGWTCSQAPLPIGAGTNYCPSFPSAVIPGSVCGHSGPTGAGFAVIEGTATGIDPNLNNSFISTAGNIDSVLPGANNLECAAFAATGQIPLMAWGTRSDLTTVEGTIPEDSQFGSPLGGQAGYLTELTSTCDTSTSSSRGISIFAIGLGLSETSQSYVYTLQNQKYQALEQTVDNAAITPTVQTLLFTDISSAENYVTAAQGGGDFTSNINCALNEIAATDTYLRANLPAFSSNLITAAPGGGNPNPAGDIDGRLANWYTALNTMLAGNAPYASWPLPPSAVPACTPASTAPQITSFTAPASAANDNVIANWTSINTTSCTISMLFAYNTDSDSGYNPNSFSGETTGGPGFGGFDIYYIIPDSDDEQTSAPPFTTPGWGSDIYTLTCYGAAGTNPATRSVLNTSGEPPASVTPLAITSFTGDGNGDLGWTTANSTANTTCTIVDEFGGDPYDQNPINDEGYSTEYLGPNQTLDGDGGYFYPYYYSSWSCPGGGVAGPPTDTITLVCSDQYNGTAMATLTINSPGCVSE